MSFARTALERLLLLGFGAARNIFLFQGLAFACAWLAARSLAPADAPAWARDAMLSALLLSVTFFVAGLGLVAARGWRVPRSGGEHAADWPWPLLLALSLLACSGLAASAGAGLPSLWREVGAELDAVGFWDEWMRPGPGGIVTIPILLALGVPALVTAAALCQLALPLLLLPLLALRSRLFPTLLALGVVCQLALVLGGWLATDTFVRLAEQAIAAMNAADDAEVLRFAEQLERWSSLVTAAASGLVPPLLMLLAWLAFLRPSGAAAAWFTEGASPSPAPAAQPEPAWQRPPLPADASRTVEGRTPASRGAARAASASPMSARRARHALAIFGAALLLFGAADGLRTRASYVRSEPAPGALLEAPPASVRVSFDAALDPASSLRLTRLVLPPYTGEQPTPIELTRRLAPDDPEQRTLEGVPTSLTAGLYRVSWQALPRGGGVPRFGSFSFGIGVPVPADEPGLTHSLLDRDSGARGRRHTFAGGALLLAIGVLLPRFAPRP